MIQGALICAEVEPDPISESSLGDDNPNLRGYSVWLYLYANYHLRYTAAIS